MRAVYYPVGYMAADLYFVWVLLAASYIAGYRGVISSQDISDFITALMAALFQKSIYRKLKEEG